MASDTALVFSRGVLRNALATVAHAADKRTIPVLGNVLIEGDGQTVIFTCSNAETEISHRVELAGPSIRAAVPVDKLLEIVRSLDDDVQIKLSQSGSNINVSWGKGRCRLKTADVADFPRMPALAGGESWTVGNGELLRLLRATQHAMATNDVRYYLNGALFDFSQSGVTVVATDGHRLATCSSPSANFAEKSQTILSRSFVNALLRVVPQSEESLTMRIWDDEASRVELVVGATTLRSRVIDGKFPDYQKVIPSAPNCSADVSRESLLAAVQRVAICSADQKSRGIEVRADETGICLSAGDAAKDSSSREDLAADVTGSIGSFGVNAHYLSDALESFQDERVTLHFTDSNGAMLMRGTNSTSPLQVVMPMRV